MTATDRADRAVAAGTNSESGVQDQRLLLLELDLVQQALRFELTEPLELFELALHVAARRCRRGRILRWRILRLGILRLGILLLLVRLVLRPPVALAAGDAVRHGRRGAGNDGGPRDSTK